VTARAEGASTEGRAVARQARDTIRSGKSSKRRAPLPSRARLWRPCAPTDSSETRGLAAADARAFRARIFGAQEKKFDADRRAIRGALARASRAARGALRGKLAAVRDASAAVVREEQRWHWGEREGGGGGGSGGRGRGRVGGHGPDGGSRSLADAAHSLFD
jgi:hypothetical protein